MEILVWLCYVVINCVVLIPNLSAKPFSLNKALAEEARQRHNLESTTTTYFEASVEQSAKKIQIPAPKKKKKSRGLAKPFSLNGAVAAESQQKRYIAAPPREFSAERRLPFKKPIKTETLKKKRKTKGFGAKKFSVNKAIAADTLQKNHFETTTRAKNSETTAERISLNKALISPALKRKKHKGIESIIPRGKKISSLKYRKSFQIKTPLKPKKTKNTLRLRQKRKNQSIQRETDCDETFTRKYIPLLRSIGMLVDNLITDAGDSFEIKRKRIKRVKGKTTESGDAVCSCKPDADVAESKAEEAVTPTTTVPSETPISPQPTRTEAPTTPADNTTPSDVSGLRPDQNVPLLLPRDTASHWRDDHGLGEGGRAAFHGSVERDFSGDHRNSEHLTGRGENESSAALYEEDADRLTRHDARRDGFRRIHGDYRDTGRAIDGSVSDEIYESTESETTPGPIRAGIDGLERKNKLEAGGDKTKSPVFLPEFVRGSGRLVPEDKIGDISESVQSEEVSEESDFIVARDIPSNQRVPVRDGAFATDYQKVNEANEGVTSLKDFSNPTIMLQSSPKTKNPFVTIIDGYSVARDINGRNKLNEKSIRYHS